jgi:hypothetical protein
VKVLETTWRKRLRACVRYQRWIEGARHPGGRHFWPVQVIIVRLYLTIGGGASP